MDNSELNEKIKAILLKKAEGYFYSEETEEYVTESEPKKVKDETKQLSFLGEEKKTGPPKKKEKLILSKKKVTTHHIPPDLDAVKILMSYVNQNSEGDLTKLSDQELKDLKAKVIAELNKL